MEPNYTQDLLKCTDTNSRFPRHFYVHWVFFHAQMHTFSRYWILKMFVVFSCFVKIVNIGLCFFTQTHLTNQQICFFLCDMSSCTKSIFWDFFPVIFKGRHFPILQGHMVNKFVAKHHDVDIFHVQTWLHIISTHFWGIYMIYRLSEGIVLEVHLPQLLDDGEKTLCISRHTPAVRSKQLDPIAIMYSSAQKKQNK